MGMDYSKLTAVVDSASAPAVKKSTIKKGAGRVVDSAKSKPVTGSKSAAEKKRIKDSLQKRVALRKFNTFKVTDAYKNYKKRIKDALEDTESTDDAVAVGVNALADIPADQAIAAVIETLGEAIDILQEQCPECGTSEEEIPAEDETAEEEEVKDSLNVTVTNGSGETVEVSTEGGDSVVSAPEVPSPEPSFEEPAIEEPAIEEGIGDSAEDDINAEQDALTGPQGKIMKLIKEGKFEEAQKLLNKNEKRLSGLGK